MRLDRVLAGPGLRPTRAEVVGRRGSDHAAVLVELERAAP
jgi:endonuclease/exonuclease/phosphatase (EEP) superfamily protein YafD